MILHDIYSYAQPRCEIFDVILDFLEFSTEQFKIS